MTKELERIAELEGRHVVQVYGRPPFLITRGEGMTVYDDEGRAYLDFVAGIAVNALGYNDEGLNRAIREALDSGVIHTSNLYHTAAHAELAALLCETSFADRVHFCNSGAEAVEGAIKFSRKVAYEAGKPDKTGIVAFSNAFHGRTMGALALTPREKYQKPFRPLMPDVAIAEFNDLESAAAVIDADTAAVFVEPVQGEGGINIATPEFMQGLRALCDENEALLVSDEIQCGMGRSGSLWAYEESGVEPDILTAAKPLAGGLPIGAILVTEAVAGALHAGDHGSTFAGGPVVTAAALEVLRRISQPAFLAQVRDVGEYLVERLEEINSPLIREVRGRGLIVGIELDCPSAALVSAGYDKGLLLLNAGEQVLRFVPPLVAQRSDIDALIAPLTDMLEDLGDA